MSAMVSVINITTSQAILNNCTFQNNCFIRIQSNTVLQISDCTFSSYNHAVHSVVAIDNSTIKLIGTVSFINNTVGNGQYYSVCGGAMSFNSGYDYFDRVPNSISSVTEAHVNFKSNTAMNGGGVIFLKCTNMTVFDKVNMTFASKKLVC